MKYSLHVLIIAIIVSACSPKKLTITSIRSSQPVEDTRMIIEILAADSMQGRKPGTPGMEKATRWVENYLHQSGIKPFFGTSYRDTLTVQGTETYNVVGFIGDRKKNSDYILIGAHLDHLGTVADSDAVYNGANDNASGVTTVLQIARTLANRKMDKNIIVALFTAEEMGLLGSKHLATRLKNTNIDLNYVINFEMTGVPMVSGKEVVYITGYKKSDFASVVNTELGYEWIKFLPKEEEYRLFMRSDNYPFFVAYQIPAHTISTFDFENFEYYHHVKDEVSALNIPHMNDVANRATLAIYKLIQNKSTITLHAER